MIPSQRLEVILSGLQAMPPMRSFPRPSERSSTVERQYTVVHTHILIVTTLALAQSTLSAFTRSSVFIQRPAGNHSGLTAHLLTALLDSIRLKAMLFSTICLMFTRTTSIPRFAFGGLQEHRRSGTTGSLSITRVGIMKEVSRDTERG